MLKHTATALLAAACLSAPLATQAADHVTTFSDAQVSAGKKLYVAECAQCHGAKLEGVTAPGLVGHAFAPEKGSSMTMGGIFQYMETNMPADKPGLLKPDEYTAIMAYLLDVNGYHGSGKELSTKGAEDSTEEFDSFVK